MGPHVGAAGAGAFMIAEQRPNLVVLKAGGEKIRCAIAGCIDQQCYVTKIFTSDGVYAFRRYGKSLRIDVAGLDRQVDRPKPRSKKLAMGKRAGASSTPDLHRLRLDFTICEQLKQ